MTITLRGPRGSRAELRRRLNLAEEDEIVDVLFNEDDEIVPECQQVLDELGIKVTITGGGDDEGHEDHSAAFAMDCC